MRLDNYDRKIVLLYETDHRKEIETPKPTRKNIRRIYVKIYFLYIFFMIIFIFMIPKCICQNVSVI